MHILVCVKQTPKSDQVTIDPTTGCLIRSSAETTLNPFDEYALETALLLKEQTGGRVSALTMGPVTAESVLRDSIARGADKGYHLCDGAFAGSDTWGTSYILAKGAEKIAQEEKIDLIICGKQSTDSDTGHIGPQISAWLGWSNASFVKKVVAVGEESLTVERLAEAGTDLLQLPFPCVISVVKEICNPRVRSVLGRMAAKRAAVTQWTAADIAADPDKLGGKNCPTRVIKTFALPACHHAVSVEGATAKDKAARLVALLKQSKSI